MIDDLVRQGVGTAHNVAFTKQQIQRQFGSAVPNQATAGPTAQQRNSSGTRYTMANDDPEEASPGGAVSGDINTEDTEEIFVDASLLDQHVRELIQAAGGSYDFKRAVENGRGRMVKMDDHLADAVLRLEQAAPLLNKVIEHAQRRTATQSPLSKVLIKAGGSEVGSQSGSASGDDSGSASGSASGSVSGQHHNHTPASIAGGYSGAVSTDGSASGDLSKIPTQGLLERYFLHGGDREVALELIRRKLK